MSDTSDAERSAWSSAGAAVLDWARTDGRRTVITAAIAFVVAWFANVYIIAVRYEGTATIPGGAATVSGNRLTGVIFWVVASAIVLTIVGYAQQVGWSRTGAELRVLPTNLLAAFRAADTNVRWAAVAWGAAVSLVVATIFSTAAAGALGLGVLLVAASPAVGLLGRGLRQVGARVLRSAVGESAAALDSGAASIATVLGAAVGMAVAWQVGPWIAKLVLAVVAAGAAAALLKRDVTPSDVAVVLLAVAAITELRELVAAVAMADDGGWREGGGSLTQWVGSSGSGRVMTQSVLGGLSGSFGAVGSAFGASLAGSGTSVLGVSLGAGVGSASGTGAADAPLAMGGLSGEFAAVEAGATPTTPAVPLPPPDAKRRGDAAGDGNADGSGGSGAQDGGTSGGAEQDLAMGGLSGEFDGDASDAPPRRGGAPGRSDQGHDDEDEADA